MADTPFPGREGGRGVRCCREGAQPLTRRGFLRTATLGLGASLWGVRLARGAEAANQRLGLAVIGAGGMGSGHLASLVGNRRVEIRAVCDVDSDHLHKGLRYTSNRAKGFGDYRELLGVEGLDAVIITTPDHWHAAIALAAMEAGKDVYVEKPMSWSVAEGRAMVETARRLGRVVQVGTQQRAQSHFRQVVELVRSGRIGEVKLVRCWKGGGGGGAWAPDSDPPPNLDWDFWLGPAPWAPYNPNRAHANWRWFWDYGGGWITDWGVHLVDIAHWAMGESRPKAVESTGTYDPEGYFETPRTMDVIYEYPSYQLSWSQNGFRGLPDKDYGILFYGSKGRLFVDRAGYQLMPEDLRVAPIGPKDFQLPRVRGHVQEFLECVVSRERPSADVAVGHTSTTACLLGNIAFRVGRKLTWDATAERFVDDPEADRLLGRTPRMPYGV